ncbi:MAG: hypothetical protein CM1200mP15_06320 [Dehalococcoidia bacterium]|nr:MAG: hypothetical protein CM1200mP15_06320 [Dehalococcoidia bacterium]
MLQGAVLREAVKFQYDASLGSEVAVAIVNESGKRSWIFGKTGYQ